jgi:hypothetical protein
MQKSDVFIFVLVPVQFKHKNIKIIAAANVANENIDAVSVTEHDLLICSEIPKSDFFIISECVSSLHSKAIELSRRAGGDQSQCKTQRRWQAKKTSPARHTGVK